LRSRTSAIVKAGHPREIVSAISDAAAKTKSSDESNDNEALGLWSGGAAIPFIKELFGATTLLVRATPFNESAVTAELPIAGLEEAIKPLREPAAGNGRRSPVDDVVTKINGHRHRLTRTTPDP
jgi:hypothetical protein